MASGNVGDGDVFGHLIEGAIAPFKASGCPATALKGAMPQRNSDPVQSRITSTPQEDFDFLIKIILSGFFKKRRLIC